jgi:hypothetical protein
MGLKQGDGKGFRCKAGPVRFFERSDGKASTIKRKVRGGIDG